MNALRVSQERLLRDIEQLGKIGATSDGGRTRLQFTPEDTQARQWLVAQMEAAGLHVQLDQVGNIRGRRDGQDNQAPLVGFGSHIDTVLNAGPLDGCCGVLAALEVIRVLQENKVQTRHPLEVISFSNEEGVRFPSLAGSRAACGFISLDEIYAYKDFQGVTYRQAMVDAGLTPESLAPAVRRKGEFKAWVELHIEQGPVLEAEQLDLGVVEAITGLIHALAVVEGRPAHAGTMPMQLRRDPMLGAAEMVLEVDRIARATGPRTVGTVGIAKALPGAFNIIPARVEFGIDFRDVDPARLAAGEAKLRETFTDIARRRQLKFELVERARLTPTPMAPEVVHTIAGAAKRLAARYKVMHSGAGHDTQSMARICPTAMIFVPSKNGISHAPDEWTDPPHVALGANVLLETVLDLAGRV